MRIIKNGAGLLQAIKVIAGEILNIETSTLYFINGEPAKLPRAECSGYPRIIQGNICDVIKAAEGYIFVPVGTDLEVFEELLINEILKMQKGMTVDDEIVNVLGTYHTIKSNHVTNIKVKSSQTLTRQS